MRSVIPIQLHTNEVRDRQAALRSRYRAQPEFAWATHLAWTEASGADPFRGEVRMSLAGRRLAFALDDGVGGPHDQPSPGELLCAALAACVDSTLRLAAAAMDVGIRDLAVIVTGDVDSRGGLGETHVPVGFQSMRVEIRLRVEDDASAGAAEALIGIAQCRSPILQTLGAAVRIVLVRSEA